MSEVSVLRLPGILGRFSDAAGPKTVRAVRSARLGVLPDLYVSRLHLAAVCAGAGVGVAVGFVAHLRGSAALVVAASAAVAGAATTLAVRLGGLLVPRVVAAGRAREIREELPAVITLCYALARGGMPVLDIFRVVAEERGVYGEISEEFATMLRATDEVGLDLLSAIGTVSETTPDPELRRFLEGVVSVVNSGADPQDYFRREAEARLERADGEAQKDLDRLGVLAEGYVSGLLILPLLLLVVLASLSVLNAKGTAFVPLIVYVLIPVGTAAYLVLLHVVLPQANRRAGRPDEGLLDSGSEALAPGTSDILAGRSPGLGYRARGVWERVVENPALALVASGPAAAVVFLLGARVASGGPIPLTGYGLLALLVALAPVAVLFEVGRRATSAREQGLAGALQRLDGMSERGVGLLSAFEILGRSTDPLAREWRNVGRDVSWTGNLRGALRRMRRRVASRRIARTCVLLERAAYASGEVRRVISVAATEADRTSKADVRGRQAMSTYVVVVYVVFAVFLYVLTTVGDLLYGGSGTSAFGGAGLAPDRARLLFLHAGVLQGAGCGLVAGRLGEGHMLSGLKHASILVLAAWAIFSGAGL